MCLNRCAAKAGLGLGYPDVMANESVAVRFYRRVPPGMRPHLKALWVSYSKLRQRLRGMIALRSRNAESTSQRSAFAPGSALSPGGGLDPFVTVVVPAYNEQTWLDDCLTSIAAQTLGDFECIVIDDCSTDYTMDIAGDWAAKEDRFSVIRHDYNRGLPSARNTGLAAARGAFITFLDADDFLFPRSLETRAKALANETDSSVIGVYCDWMPVAEDTPLDLPPRTAVDKVEVVSFIGQRGEIPFIATAPMLRTAEFRALQGFNETMRSSEDFEAWMRVMRHGYRFTYVKDVGVSYRQRRSGMVLGAPADHALAAVAVLGQLEAPLDNASRIDGTPYRFDEPLSVYEHRLRVIRRLIPSLALAIASGDQAQIDGLSRLIPADSWFFAKDHVDIGKLAQNALNRIVRADPNFTPERRDQIAALVTSTVETLLARSGHVDDADQVDAAPAPTPLRKSGDGVIEVVEPRIFDIAQARELFGGIVMFPMARYHVEEMVPLARALEACGVSVSWVVTRHHPEDVRVEMRRHGVSVLFNPPENWSDLPPFAGAVMLNDWGPTKDLIDVARERGVPTFAKVEGVQDFDDVDTGRVRKPYRWADIVLCQGANDVRSLEGATTHIVGSSRLEPIAVGPERCFGSGRQVVVNSNFTYNVLTDERSRWLDSVLRAGELAEVDILVSQHQADGVLPAGTPISAAPMRHLLTYADVLVSRFSTVPFEAMARGVPFVYHNPHGERVPTFAKPGEAFRIGSSAETLAAAITEALDWRGTYRERSAGFFAEQVSIEIGTSSAERAAQVILQAIGADAS